MEARWENSKPVTIQAKVWALRWSVQRQDWRWLRTAWYSRGASPVTFLFLTDRKCLLPGTLSHTFCQAVRQPECG